MLRRFLAITGLGVALFIVGVLLHNLISGLLGIEEPVFSLLAVAAAPVLVAIGVAGSVVVLVRKLAARGNR